MKIQYFARDGGLGTTAEGLALPSEVEQVDQFLAHLRGRGEPWTSPLEGVQITVNRAFATFTTAITDGDEIGLIPQRR